VRVLLAVHVTPSNEQERAQVKQLAEEVQAVTLKSVEVAFVDEDYIGPQTRADAKTANIELIVVKRPEAKRVLCYCPGTGW
jgi:hypothetical protein